MTSVAEELSHRLGLWSAVSPLSDASTLEARTLNELRIYFGGRGIWVHKERTRTITPEGVAVGVLHTGRSYADDLYSDGIVYHYPKTKNPGTDTAEVRATKAAKRLELPVFVVVQPGSGSRRTVYLGWVTDWDDDDRIFLIRFGEKPPPPPPTVEEEDDAPFNLTQRKPPKKPSMRTPRPDRAEFRFRVLRRYSAACAVCDLAVPELLDAAHFRAKEDSGSDDPRNGLPLCKTHHRAMDLGLFRIEPATRRVRVRPTGPSLESLKVTRSTLGHLPNQPHPLALEWCWRRWKHRDAVT